MTPPKPRPAISQADYQRLSQFRYLIRRFLEFSQVQANEAGLTPRQLQVVRRVAEMDQLQQAIEQAARHFGRLDCLINNAGTHPPATTIDDTSIADVERLMRITRDDTMTSLVHAKLTLAQTDYDNLELQASSSPLHYSATHALLFVLILTMQLQASQLECHARFSPFSGM